MRREDRGTHGKGKEGRGKKGKGREGKRRGGEGEGREGMTDASWVQGKKARWGRAGERGGGSKG